METSISILLLEDSEFDAELICEHLARMSSAPQIERVSTRNDYLAALQDNSYDVILCDYSLPGYDGMSALRHAREAAPSTPFIFVSGVLGEETAIASFNNGATDYVLKQRLIRLPAAVERAVAEAREKEERRRAERQAQLMVAELSHRVKNTLATVMSIARRTAKSASTVEEYQEALMSRLRALSEAHALVFEANWRETDLRRVLERTLEPFRRASDQTSIQLDGPEVTLDPRHALTLSLVFHELATNASKYGSLSRDNGVVQARWRKIADGAEPVIEFVWTEEGGPPVEVPQHSGFGRMIMERSLAHEMDGSADLQFAPNGLICRLSFTPA